LAHDHHGRLSAAEGRRFALTVGAAFLALGAVLWSREHPMGARILAGVGGTLVILGIAVPGKLGPLYRAWMGLALAISKVTTPIFMAVVFFLVITPISFVMRAVGKRPLRYNPAASSYWRPRAEADRRSDLTRQF
jgi:hypothetical protein